MRRFNKHIIIVGSARSGTSWLAETIAKQYRYRSLFEPEHQFNTTKGHLLCDRLVTQTEGFEEGNAYLKKIFANRVDNDWIAQNSNRKWKRHLWPFIPKKFVVKFVRCNLAAQYMQQEFGIPVVHIIRNPYDVLHSQKRVNFPWLYDISKFKDDEELAKLLKDHFQFDVQTFEVCSPLETLAIRWCIENVVPISMLKSESPQYRLIRHEDLRNDIDLFFNLCNDFNLKPLHDLDKEYTKPSSKTHPKSELFGADASNNKFSEHELREINSILDTFESNFYPRQHP